MNTDRQRFRNLLTTTGTYLTGTIGIYFNQYAPSFFRFVRKEVKEHTPTTISYAFGKMLVPQTEKRHIQKIKTLNAMLYFPMDESRGFTALSGKLF
jgi:hypothetical protein